MKLKGILSSLLIAFLLCSTSFAASYSTIQLRRATAASWSSTNPIPAQGEPCFETDTGKMKIGTGIAHYNSLPYLPPAATPGVTYPYPYEIDALASYGGGTSYTQATIQSALTAIGTTNKVTLLLRPGTWVISSDANWSAYTNVTFKIARGAILSHGAFTVNIPNRDLGGAVFQWLTGTGRVTFSGTTSEVYPDEFAENAVPNTTDMTAAIQAAINSGRRDGSDHIIAVSVKLLDQIYSFTELTIPDYTASFYMGSKGGSVNAQLRSADDTKNGITIGKSFADSRFDNITINTKTGAGAGTAIISDHINSEGSSNFVLNNVSITGWKKGVKIGGGVKFTIQGGGNIAGLGAATVGGIGIELGTDAGSSLNQAQIRDSLITAFETGIYNKYCTDLEVTSTIIGTTGVPAGTGALLDVGQNHFRMIYFESVSTSINKGAAAYLYGSWTLTGGAGEPVLANHRFGQESTGFSRLVAYDTNAQTITGGAGYTVITLQHLEESDDLSYVIATDLYTARHQGHYLVTPYVTFSATGAAQSAVVQVFKATPPAAAAAIPYFDGVYWSAAAGTIGGSQTRLIWLEAGDTLQVKAATSADMAVPAARLDVVSLGL